MPLAKALDYKPRDWKDAALCADLTCLATGNMTALKFLGQTLEFLLPLKKDWLMLQRTDPKGCSAASSGAGSLGHWENPVPAVPTLFLPSLPHAFH